MDHVPMNYATPVDRINILSTVFITDSQADTAFMEKIKELDIKVIIK
jgi:hypothetical protein